MASDSLIPMPPFHLCVLFFYFIEYFMALCSWWFFSSSETALFGSVTVDAQQAFIVLGTLIFFIVASPCIFFPYYYGRDLEYKVRRNFTVMGIGISWLVHDMPLWFIEFNVVWNYGWVHLLQGVSFLLISIAFAIGFFAVWLGYTWKMSKFLQNQFGGSDFTVAVADGGGPMQGDDARGPRTI